MEVLDKQLDKNASGYFSKISSKKVPVFTELDFFGRKISGITTFGLIKVHEKVLRYVFSILLKLKLLPRQEKSLNSA